MDKPSFFYEGTFNSLNARPGYYILRLTSDLSDNDFYNQLGDYYLSQDGYHNGDCNSTADNPECQGTSVVDFSSNECIAAPSFGLLTPQRSQSKKLFICRAL